jgi:hypothetical protein
MYYHCDKLDRDKLEGCLGKMFNVEQHENATDFILLIGEIETSLHKKYYDDRVNVRGKKKALDINGKALNENNK